MKLTFAGKDGAGLCDWDSFALFRDNVQHYIEGGVKGSRFSTLHAIAEAVDGGSCAVDAVRLRIEVLRAWEALWPVELENAAVSTRTEAVRRGKPLPVSDSTTSRRDEAAVRLPAVRYPEQPLPRAAQAFVSTVLSLTKAATAGDQLQVRRIPSRVARKHASRGPNASRR
jgi:hypothetical protein